MSKLDLATTHLNTPYGNVVTIEHLSSALRAGTVEMDSIPELSAAIISTAFNELSTNLIIQCVYEAGASIESANRLYKETLEDHRYPSPGWEALVKGVMQNTIKEEKE